MVLGERGSVDKWIVQLAKHGMGLVIAECGRKTDLVVFDGESEPKLNIQVPAVSLQ